MALFRCHLINIGYCSNIIQITFALIIKGETGERQSGVGDTKAHSSRLDLICSLITRLLLDRAINEPAC